MKAKEVEIGSRVSREGESGTIVGNQHKDGDEIVIVEWDDRYDDNFEKVNVNDLIIRPKRTKSQLPSAQG